VRAQVILARKIDTIERMMMPDVEDIESIAGRLGAWPVEGAHGENMQR
jgi:hypothetical protein